MPITLKMSLGRLLQKTKHETISREAEGEDEQRWVIRVAYWQLSRVAYNILIVEIRANIYFSAVRSMPLCPVSPAKARRTAYLLIRASEKYDSWMHSSRCVHTVHSRAVTAQPLFMFLPAHSCARVQQSKSKCFLESRAPSPLSLAVRIDTMPWSVINRETVCVTVHFVCFNLSYSGMCLCVWRKNLDRSYSMHE